MHDHPPQEADLGATTLPWVNAVVGTIDAIAIGLLIALNGLFALGVVVRRDRAVVQRWTKPLVIVDAMLLLAAVGAPVAGSAITLGAKGVAYVASIPARLMPTK